MDLYSLLIISMTRMDCQCNYASDSALGNGHYCQFYAIVQLMKLPKNLLAKTSMIKNTGQVLEQMPQVISSLDAHMEYGLQSVPHLKPVAQLLANMESSQLSSLSQAHLALKEPELENHHKEVE
ncbi:hypothetical protein Pint_01141 [Pistacia integerrima]|uniref:Uncharacterized protein n=1 Tax=Pistacia integerrima TaxID=434235 RepID=A0ACC0ZK42_9ROSI|nr:hypothetical protein Pint_01141 [Pistacia integerrima]